MSILLHETLCYFALNQSRLTKVKIVSAVILPHEAK